MTEVEIYTDGACRGNPGPGGWGALLLSGTHRRELKGGEANTTNNRMELTAALARLGITANRATNYQSNFGISLQVQTPLEIGGGVHALMTAQNQATMDTPAETALSPDMQTLLTEAKALLGAATGGYPMVMIDQPLYQAETAPVILVAQNNAGQQNSDSNSHVLGECMVARVGDEGTGAARLSPVSTADIFFRGPYAKEINWQAATISVIQQPKHGSIKFWDWLGSQEASYISEKGYTGNDSLILKVTGPDYSLEIHYFFRVLDQEGFSGKEILDNPDCKAEEWTISATLPQQPYTFGSDALTNYFLKDVSVSLHITNLANGAVGETVDHNITLDDDGAGHGWFIDSTPADNSEFLPTSNPNEWIAKPGSEAAGKMDLLTVLLHEYGHALGLDHNADMHDFMAEELQPGVRRTVSDNDMAALWSLLGRVDIPVVHQPLSYDASLVDIQDVHPTGNGSDPSAPFNPLPLSLSFMFGFARRRIDINNDAGQGIVLPPLSLNGTGGDPNAVTIENAA